MAAGEQPWQSSNGISLTVGEHTMSGSVWHQRSDIAPMMAGLLSIIFADLELYTVCS